MNSNTLGYCLHLLKRFVFWYIRWTLIGIGLIIAAVGIYVLALCQGWVAPPASIAAPNCHTSVDGTSGLDIVKSHRDPTGRDLTVTAPTALIGDEDFWSKVVGNARHGLLPSPFTPLMTLEPGTKLYAGDTPIPVSLTLTPAQVAQHANTFPTEYDYVVVTTGRATGCIAYVNDSEVKAA
jgi:hypothetical protein